MDVDGLFVLEPTLVELPLQVVLSPPFTDPAVLLLLEVLVSVRAALLCDLISFWTARVEQWEAPDDVS